MNKFIISIRHTTKVLITLIYKITLHLYEIEMSYSVTLLFQEVVIKNQ